MGNLRTAMARGNVSRNHVELDKMSSELLRSLLSAV